MKTIQNKEETEHCFSRDRLTTVKLLKNTPTITAQILVIQYRQTFWKCSRTQTAPSECCSYLFLHRNGLIKLFCISAHAVKQELRKQILFGSYLQFKTIEFNLKTFFCKRISETVITKMRKCFLQFHLFIYYKI